MGGRQGAKKLQWVGVLVCVSSSVWESQSVDSRFLGVGICGSRDVWKSWYVEVAVYESR